MINHVSYEGHVLPNAGLRLKGTLLPAVINELRARYALPGFTLPAVKVAGGSPGGRPGSIRSAHSSGGVPRPLCHAVPAHQPALVPQGHHGAASPLQQAPRVRRQSV